MIYKPSLGRGMATFTRHGPHRSRDGQPDRVQKLVNRLFGEPVIGFGNSGWVMDDAGLPARSVVLLQPQYEKGGSSITPASGRPAVFMPAKGVLGFTAPDLTLMEELSVATAPGERHTRNDVH